MKATKQTKQVMESELLIKSLNAQTLCFVDCMIALSEDDNLEYNTKAILNKKLSIMRKELEHLEQIHNSPEA